MRRTVDGRGPETSLCWTVQHVAVWHTLQETGVYRAQPEHIDPDYVPAYDWLRREMALRIPGAAGCYPIWSYVHSDRKMLRHFLRTMLRPRDQILLVCRVPTKQLLLVDDYTWHIVLNGWHLSYDESAEAVDAWWDAIERQLTPEQIAQGKKGHWPADVQAELEASWCGVFDTAHWLQTPREPMLQAVFEELRLEHVVQAGDKGFAHPRRYGF